MIFKLIHDYFLVSFILLLLSVVKRIIDNDTKLIRRIILRPKLLFKLVLKYILIAPVFMLQCIWENL